MYDVHVDMNMCNASTSLQSHDSCMCPKASVLTQNMLMFIITVRSLRGPHHTYAATLHLCRILLALRIHKIYLYICVYIHFYIYVHLYPFLSIYIYICVLHTHLATRVKVAAYVAVCCSVLQCVTVRCNVLQRVAVPLETCQGAYSICLYSLRLLTQLCCSVVQCGAVCCSALQCVAVCFSVLQCVAVYCSVLQCVAVCCSVLQCL